MSRARAEQRAAQMAAALEANGVSHVVVVPDSESGWLLDAVHSSPIQAISACREGEALAIAVGLWAGGESPVVLIQSTGLYESGDSIRGLILDARVPLVVLVGYRGLRGERPFTDSAARYLEPVLEAWNLASWRMEEGAEAAAIHSAFAHAREHAEAAVVLVPPPPIARVDAPG